jgi:PilZ domain
MERRFSSRAQVDVPVTAYVDGARHACRVIDLSASGMVFQQNRSLALLGELPTVNRFELFLGPNRPIRARARSVWSREGLQAVSFVLIHDADRLVIAEHLDRLARWHQMLH